MSPGPRWALAGGGTGGHIVPGLHLLEALRERGEHLDHLLWFTSGRSVEQRVLADLEVTAPAALVERVALPLEPEGGGAPSLPGLARRLLPATLRARRALRGARCELVLGLGGFTAAPAVLAARSLGLPAYLLEVNTVAGRATRMLAPLARRVFHGHAHSLPAGASSGERHVVVGPVVGPGFGALQREEARPRIDEAHGLPGDRPLLLVLGGSQGAAGLNRFLQEHAQQLLAGCCILHQVGPGRLEEAAEVRPGDESGEVSGYVAAEYLTDIPLLLAGADLVLCRGGASTLAEVRAAGAPAVVVPYPHHKDGHQARNATELGLEVVEERELGAATVGRLLERLRDAALVPRLGGGDPGSGPVLDELLGA